MAQAHTLSLERVRGAVRSCELAQGDADPMADIEKLAAAMASVRRRIALELPPGHTWNSTAAENATRTAADIIAETTVGQARTSVSVVANQLILRLDDAPAGSAAASERAVSRTGAIIHFIGLLASGRSISLGYSMRIAAGVSTDAMQIKLFTAVCMGHLHMLQYSLAQFAVSALTVERSLFAPRAAQLLDDIRPQQFALVSPLTAAAFGSSFNITPAVYSSDMVRDQLLLMEELNSLHSELFDRVSERQTQARIFIAAAFLGALLALVALAGSFYAFRAMALAGKLRFATEEALRRRQLTRTLMHEIRQPLSSLTVGLDLLSGVIASCAAHVAAAAAAHAASVESVTAANAATLATGDSMSMPASSSASSAGDAAAISEQAVAEAGEIVGILQRGVARMGRLTTDSLDLERMESATLPLSVRPCSLLAEAEQAVQEASFAARPKGVRLTLTSVCAPALSALHLSAAAEAKHFTIVPLVAAAVAGAGSPTARDARDPLSVASYASDPSGTGPQSLLSINAMSCSTATQSEKPFMTLAVPSSQSLEATIGAGLAAAAPALTSLAALPASASPALLASGNDMRAAASTFARSLASNGLAKLLADGGGAPADFVPAGFEGTTGRGVPTDPGAALGHSVPAGLMLMLDSDRLRQVLLNLITNAVRHAPQGSDIEVAVRVSLAGGSDQAPATAPSTRRCCTAAALWLAGRKRTLSSATVAPAALFSTPLVGSQQSTTAPTAQLTSTSAASTSTHGAVALGDDAAGRSRIPVLVSISISDAGAGITPEKQALLFQPFSQLHDSSRDGQGTAGSGLGLAVSRSLVQLMGGDISVSSTPPRGTTFTVRFHTNMVAPAQQVSALVPAAFGSTAVTVAPLRDAQLRSAADAVAAVSAPSQPLCGRGLRVLAVDDAAANLLLLTKLLRALGAETVNGAQDGAEAVAAVQAAEAAGVPFHAILLDRHMPIMDGETCARTLRGPTVGYTGVIIAVSADADESFLAAGADALVHKPVQRAELVATLCSQLSVRSSP